MNPSTNKNNKSKCKRSRIRICEFKASSNKIKVRGILSNKNKKLVAYINTFSLNPIATNIKILNK